MDYNIRIRMLEELRKRESKTSLSQLARDLTINKDNGMIKLYLIYKTLDYRRKNREIFDRGEYFSIEVMGDKTNNVCVLSRRIGNSIVVAVSPRFFTKLIQQGDLPFGEEVWKDTFIVLPFDIPGAKYHNIFTGEIVTAMNYKGATILYLSEIFVNFSVALLERIY